MPKVNRRRINMRRENRGGQQDSFCVIWKWVNFPHAEASMDFGAHGDGPRASRHSGGSSSRVSGATRQESEPVPSVGIFLNYNEGPIFDPSSESDNLEGEHNSAALSAVSQTADNQLLKYNEGKVFEDSSEDEMEQLTAAVEQQMASPKESLAKETAQKKKSSRWERLYWSCPDTNQAEEMWQQAQSHASMGYCCLNRFHYHLKVLFETPSDCHKSPSKL